MFEGAARSRRCGGGSYTVTLLCGYRVDVARPLVRSRPARSSRIPWIHCHWHVDPCRVVQQVLLILSYWFPECVSTQIDPPIMPI
jgi:hypothetical protein